MSQKEKKWVATTERFVLFLDIMGFKDMVARNTHKHIYKNFQSLAKSVLSEKRSTNIYTSIFSDSIVIFSRNKSQEALHDLVWAASSIFIYSLTLHIPLKGCLSFGKLTVDRELQVFFGQPLIDAYLLEEELLYFGVVIHHTAERVIRAWKYNMPYFIEMPVIFKSGISTHLNLVWPSIYEIMSSDISPKKGYCLDPLKLADELKIVMSGAPRRYLDNTIKFIEELRKKSDLKYKYADE